MNFDLNSITTLLVNYGTKLLIAIVIWIVGSIIVRLLKRVFFNLLNRQQVSETLQPFLKALIGFLLNVILFITVLGTLGVEMASFIAILGAAGLAVGLSLSGTLQNFAGGIILLVLKPFRVRDFIEINGEMGVVHAIQIFHTTIVTLDNRHVIIPNSNVISNVLLNYTEEPIRRVDLTFGVAYGSNIKEVKQVFEQVAIADDRVLKDPAFFFGVTELADSSVNFTFRVWVKTENYWDVFFDMNERVYDALYENGISIPFPQMDVHIQQTSSSQKKATLAKSSKVVKPSKLTKLSKKRIKK